MNSDSTGFTLIELLIVMGIIGILAAIAVPLYSNYQVRAYDSHARTGLHHLYVACKSYWVDQGGAQPCNVAIASGTSYGFQASNQVIISSSGNENNFSATAKHSSSPRTFNMNAAGRVQ